MAGKHLIQGRERYKLARQRAVEKVSPFQGWGAIGGIFQGLAPWLFTVGPPGLKTLSLLRHGLHNKRQPAQRKIGFKSEMIT